MDALLQSAWFGPFVKGTLTVLLISGAVLLAFLIGYGLRKLMFPKLVKLHTINLTNSGNVSGCYNLKAVAQEEFLQLSSVKQSSFAKVEISSGKLMLVSINPVKIGNEKNGFFYPTNSGCSPNQPGKTGAAAGKLLKGSEKLLQNPALQLVVGLSWQHKPGVLGKS